MIVSVSEQTTAVEIPADDPRAVELVLAVRGGDIDTILRLLAEGPRLARAGLSDHKGGFKTPAAPGRRLAGLFPQRLADRPPADPGRTTCASTAPATPPAGGLLTQASPQDPVSSEALTADGMGRMMKVPYMSRAVR